MSPGECSVAISKACIGTRVEVQSFCMIEALGFDFLLRLSGRSVLYRYYELLGQIALWRSMRAGLDLARAVPNWSLLLICLLPEELRAPPTRFNTTNLDTPGTLIQRLYSTFCNHASLSRGAMDGRIPDCIQLTDKCRLLTIAVAPPVGGGWARLQPKADSRAFASPSCVPRPVEICQVHLTLDWTEEVQSLAMSKTHFVNFHHSAARSASGRAARTLSRI